MKKSLIALAALFAVTTLCPAPTRADTKLVPDVQLTTGVPAWNARFQTTLTSLQQGGTYPADGYTECAQAVELPGAYICLSDTEANMDLAFARCSLYTEGDLGVAQGTVISQTDPVLTEALTEIGGNDLKSTDLLSFYDKAQDLCKTSSGACLNSQETDLYSNVVLPLAKSQSPFVVISYALDDGGMTYQEVVSHEIMHAQYFLEPPYRQVADDFWANTLTEAERVDIRSALAVGYDASDDYLMRNEFQAYMLMAHGDQALLGKFVPMYRDALLAKMHEAGIEPIQVQ